jgi:hypothetical protein
MVKNPLYELEELLCNSVASFVVPGTLLHGSLYPGCTLVVPWWYLAGSGKMAVRLL